MAAKKNKDSKAWMIPEGETRERNLSLPST